MTISHKLTISVCVIVVILQTAYLLIPTRAVILFDQGFRPFLYAVLVVSICVFIGTDARPVAKSYEAKMMAAFSALLYGVTFTVLVHLFGGGINALQPGSWIIAGRNAWVLGTVVISASIIRFKLVKATNNNSLVNFWITLVLAYGQIPELRTLLRTGNLQLPDFIFAYLFVAITISAVATFFAIRGCLLSVVTVSAVYSLVPFFVPILPQVLPIVWGLTICGILFLSALFLNHLTNDRSRDTQIRNKRTAKLEKKSPVRYGFALTMIGCLCAFFLQVFPIYPVVILTESMTNSINRGSLVFIHRVPSSEAFIRVGEGDIIHFSHGRIEFVHRVVAFEHDIYGNRIYITQGDANEMADPQPVYQENVLGIAQAFLPLVGYPYVIIRSLLGG